MRAAESIKGRIILLRARPRNKRGQSSAHSFSADWQGGLCSIEKSSVVSEFEEVRLWRYCGVAALSVVPAATAFPMASPLTTSLPRRFLCRPSAVSLEATGWLLPKPFADIEDPGTPCSARKSRTESERRSESC